MNWKILKGFYVVTLSDIAVKSTNRYIWFGRFAAPFQTICCSLEDLSFISPSFSIIDCTCEYLIIWNQLRILLSDITCSEIKQYFIQPQGLSRTLQGRIQKVQIKEAEDLMRDRKPTPPPPPPQWKIQVRGDVAYNILGAFVTKS